YLRGSIWYEAGDFATAALFFKHAYDLKPDNGVYLAMYLACLSHANDPRALAEAQKVVSEYKKHSPIANVRAADIVFMSAKQLSDGEGNRIFLAIEPILKEAVQVANTE